MIKPTFIESSICGDYLIILEIVYAALGKKVPFIIVDLQTANQQRSPFTSYKRFSQTLTSSIVADYTYNDTEEQHVLKMLAGKTSDDAMKPLLLINVDTMYRTWFEKEAKPTREMAMHFVLQEMVVFILNKQLNAVISIREKPNPDGRQQPRFIASLTDTFSFIEKKQLQIQLGTVAERNIPPENQAKASTNFILIVRNPCWRFTKL
jgi:hypothetical protein